MARYNVRLSDLKIIKYFMEEHLGGLDDIIEEVEKLDGREGDHDAEDVVKLLFICIPLIHSLSHCSDLLEFFHESLRNQFAERKKSR